MTPEERGDVVVTARLLRAASHIQWLAVGLTIVSSAAFVFGVGNRAATLLAILIGVVATLYAFRVAFDARLFEDIVAGTLSRDELDHGLTALGNTGRPERPWSDRCRGARRLVIRGAVATGAQVIAMIAASLS